MMISSFPNRRGRRLRQNNGIRALVRETSLGKSDLICPIFLREGTNIIENSEIIIPAGNSRILNVNILLMKIFKDILFSFKIETSRVAITDDPNSKNNTIKSPKVWAKAIWPKLAVPSLVAMNGKKNNANK